MFPKLHAVVVFVRDLNATREFYERTLGLPVTFSDDVSVGFKFEGLDFLILTQPAAAEMITPETVGVQGRSVLLCVGVKNADEAYEALKAKGVEFIKPPVDQAWGRRTAYFADPEGNLWEIWQDISGTNPL
jgi:catechol 2,3-dioxygenase-like lactoylglutathione lyase family enzyme